MVINGIIQMVAEFVVDLIILGAAQILGEMVVMFGVVQKTIYTLF